MSNYSSQKQALTSLKSTPLDADGVTCLHCGGNILDSETPKTCVASQLPHRTAAEAKKAQEENEEEDKKKEEEEAKKKEQEEKKKEQQKQKAYNTFYSGVVEDYDDKTLCCLRGCFSKHSACNFCPEHHAAWNSFKTLIPLENNIPGLCYAKGCRCKIPERQKGDRHEAQGGCFSQFECYSRYCSHVHGKDSKVKLSAEELAKEPWCPNAQTPENVALARQQVFRVTIFAHHAPISLLLATHYSVMQLVVLFIPPFDHSTCRIHMKRSAVDRAVSVESGAKFLKEKSLFFDSLLNTREKEKTTQTQQLLRKLASSSS